MENNTKGGDVQTRITRRLFLGGVAAASVPGVSIASSANDPPVYREDLDHYYTFLWLELIALSNEMGVEMHSHSIMHRTGGHEAYQRLCKAGPPSSRAKAVLAIRG
jgi:hypothetical protein